MRTFDAVTFIWTRMQPGTGCLAEFVRVLTERGEFTGREGQQLFAAAKVFEDVYSPATDDMLRAIAEHYAKLDEAQRFERVLKRLSRDGTRQPSSADKQKARKSCLPSGRVVAAAPTH